MTAAKPGKSFPAFLQCEETSRNDVKTSHTKHGLTTDTARFRRLRGASPPGRRNLIGHGPTLGIRLKM
jgi:hypothetical protein